jgi:HEPN domain-containing protein
LSAPTCNTKPVGEGRVATAPGKLAALSLLLLKGESTTMHMDISEKIATLNDCARIAFRDTADRDYICSRACYRMNLYSQCMWAAHQAIEKYLKGTLLFRLEPAKGYGHDLGRLLETVSGHESPYWLLPPRLQTFIEFLNDFGSNRYRDAHLERTGTEFFLIDQTVWHIRWYCTYLESNDGTCSHDDRGEYTSDYQHILAQIRARQPSTKQIRGGVLEEVLARSPTDAARRALVWKNALYTERPRKQIKFNGQLRIENSIQVIHKQRAALLLEYIDFSKPVKEYLVDQAKRNES